MTFSTELGLKSEHFSDHPQIKYLKATSLELINKRAALQKRFSKIKEEQTLLEETLSRRMQVARAFSLLCCPLTSPVYLASKCFCCCKKQDEAEQNHNPGPETYCDLAALALKPSTACCCATEPYNHSLATERQDMQRREMNAREIKNDLDEINTQMQDIKSQIQTLKG